MKNFQKATPLDHPKRKSHRLILGPFQPDLEDELLTLVRAKKEGDPLRPVVALVGSNLLGLYLRRLFVLRGFDHFNLRLLTLLEFAGVIAGETLNLEGLRPLPKFGDLVTIRALAERMETGYFQPIARRRGFQKALAATFRDLADGGVKKFPAGKDRKLEELQSLYQLHRAGVDKGFYDQADILFRAAREIHRFPEIFRGEELILYGFYDFTQGQEQLIRACGRRLNLDAFMPWRETPAFAYASPTFELYKDLGFKYKLGEIRKGEKVIPPTSPKGSFCLGAKRKQGQQPGKAAPSGLSLLPGRVMKSGRSSGKSCASPAMKTFPFMRWPFCFGASMFTAPLFSRPFRTCKFPFTFREASLYPAPRKGKAPFFSSTWPAGICAEGRLWGFSPLPGGLEAFFCGRALPLPNGISSRGKRGSWKEGINGKENSRPSCAKEKRRNGRRGKAELFCRGSPGILGVSKQFLLFPGPVSQERDLAGPDAFLLLLDAYFEESETREAVFDALRDLAPLDALTREVDIFLFREIAAEALEEKTLRLGSFQKNGVCVST